MPNGGEIKMRHRVHRAHWVEFAGCGKNRAGRGNVCKIKLAKNARIRETPANVDEKMGYQANGDYSSIFTKSEEGFGFEARTLGLCYTAGGIGFGEYDLGPKQWDPGIKGKKERIRIGQIVCVWAAMLVDHSTQVGMQAYALKTAAMYRRMVTHAWKLSTKAWPAAGYTLAERIWSERRDGTIDWEAAVKEDNNSSVRIYLHSARIEFDWASRQSKEIPAPIFAKLNPAGPSNTPI
ncbi:hypothetical protein B0H19DRAFT_1081499 [Mycena capillaripes]|nr:hypothetical protein B0H19DRAFT_1081499 [Mycena capillaripes]